MSIEISSDAYSWLSEIGCISGSEEPAMTTNGRVVLDPTTSSLMESGLAFGRMVRALNQEHELINGRPLTASALDSLKEANTPPARLSNWNKIIKALANVDIRVDNDTKRMIIAGDTAIVSELIDEVYVAHFQNLRKMNAETQARASDSFRVQKNDGQLGKMEAKSQTRGKKAPQQKKQGALDITSLNTQKMVGETESCLEFLLNTLCRNIDLKPKQAAGLLTSGNKYLAHILIKGVKGVFDPVIQWYQDIYQNEAHLVDLIALEENQGSVTMILGALRPGLLSKNGDVALWASRLMSKVAYDFSDRNLISPAWEWFISENGGVDASLMCFQRHAEIKEAIVNVFIQFGRYNFMELFTLQLKNHLPSSAEYLEMMHEFLIPISESRTSKEEIVNSGILDYWIDMALKQAQNEQRGPIAPRLVAMHFACDLWLNFPEVFEEREDVTTSVQTILKRATRDKLKSVKSHALGLMFRMLDFFASERNPYAPVFYKILTFCLVENHTDLNVREFLMSNFTFTFDSLPTIPVGILVEPLIKQIQVSEGVTYFYQVFDFDFFVTLARHPRLTIKNAIQLLDLLAKIYLNDVVHARPASIPFVLIVQRHAENETIQDFVQKYSKISLAMFMSLEKKKRPKPVNLPKYNNRPVVVGGKLSEVEKESEHLNLQKRGLIIELIKKLILVRSDTLDEKLRPLVVNTNYQLKQATGKDHKGMMMLMSLWGDNPRDQMRFYELEYSDMLMLKNAPQMKQLTDGGAGNVREERKEPVQSAHGTRKSVEGRELVLRDSMESRMSDRSAISEKMEVSKYEDKSRKYLPLQSTISKKKMPSAHQRVLDDIERIKRKKEEKLEYERQREANMRRKEDRAKRSLKNQLEKRKLELGVATRNKKDIAHNIVFKEGAIDAYKKKDKHSPEIQLLNLSDEEEKDQEAVDLMMKKYQRALKLLFNTYCNSGFDVNRKKSTFDSLAHGFKCIKSPEVLKMLRDHEVITTFMTRDDLTTIMRLVNLKQGKTSELTLFPYKGFEEFFLQMSIHCFSKPPKDLSHLPPASSVQAMLDHFAEITRKKGRSATVYEDPDELSMLGDKDLIKELNKKLAEDPKYPLPEGYKKHEDKQIEMKYELPSFPGIDDKFKDCFEVLDQIFNDAIGVHIIEPVSEYKTVLKARPVIMKPKLQPQFLNYDPQKPKKLPNLRERAPSVEKGKPAPRKKVVTEVKPKLNPSMKLLVANYGKPERMHVQEVAEVLEEVLKAVGEGKSSIGQRHKLGPGNIFNRALEMRMEAQAEEKRERDEREKKRKMRRQVLGKQAEKESQARQKAEAEKKEKEEEEKKKEAEKKKKRAEKAKKEKEERDKKIKEFKEEKERKVKEAQEKEEEEKKKDVEKKKKEQSEFMKKQRTLHDKKMKELSAKNEQAIIDDILEQVREEEKRGVVKKTDEQLMDQIKRKLVDSEKGKYLAKQNKLKSQQTLAAMRTMRNPEKEIAKAKEEKKDEDAKEDAGGEDGAELKPQKTIVPRDTSQGGSIVDIDYDEIDDPKLDERVKKIFDAVKVEIDKIEKERKKKELKMKKEAERTKKEKERNQEMTDLFNTKAIKDVFEKYTKNLNKVFKFYCKTSNQSTGFDLEKFANNLHLKEYVKFAHHYNITPGLLTMDDVTYTFRTITKEREKRDRDSGVEPITALAYQDFEEVLFRLAVTGQKVLGGVKEEAKKENAKDERGQYTNLTTDFVVSATTPETVESLIKYLELDESAAAVEQKLTNLNDKYQKSDNPREKRKAAEKIQKEESKQETQEKKEGEGESGAAGTGDDKKESEAAVEDDGDEADGGKKEDAKEAEKAGGDGAAAQEH